MYLDMLKKISLCVLALCLFACSSAAGPGQCRVLIVLQATKSVNPDRTGESLPTVVRFFQLKDIASLKNASFQDIWQREAEVLGKDLSDVHETTIYPADRQTQVIPIKDDAVYLAAGALFRTPQGNYWRTYTKLPPFGTKDRCLEDEPGGPYYFQVDGTRVKGSEKPIPLVR
ncbi:MAG: type VI secretion system lipoprotein TssJ [Deltaproteobacteria bacterium]|nr:type VI secretion system lipoprotein TssJ [Deltaproteobacteria bacterium]